MRLANAMDSTKTARHALREATAAQHDAVDAAFGGYDLADRDDYRAFLMAQAAAFLPVEAAIDAAGGARVLADWPLRRRGAALVADLAALGETPVAAAPPALDDDAAVLGAIYVLEGSRLGGTMLARSIPADFPQAFLTSPDDRRWRRLTDALDIALATPQHLSTSIAAARMVFALFDDAARRFART